MAGMGKSSLKLNIPDCDPNDNKAIADFINQKFSQVSLSLPPLDITALPTCLPTPNPLPQIHPWEVYDKLSKIKSNKAPGPDQVPQRVLKDFACELSGPVCNILNTSFHEGITPPQWKEAIVIPVPKTQPPSVEQLRPISLTPQLSKIAEGFVANWVKNDISPHLDPAQFGSRPGRSSTHALVSILDTLYKASDTPATISTFITTDFSKAFDKVDLNVAMERLLKLGVRPALMPWLCSFVSGRRQAVRYQDCYSSWAELTGGVAQGTLLGPIIFLALINCAATDIPNRWKYVDDLNLIHVCDADNITSPQTVLDNLDSWVLNSQMALNPSKCKTITVTFRRNPPPPVPLFLCGKQLPTCESVKVLGVQIQSDLKWNEHTDAMVKKANTKLYFLRRLRRSGVPKSDLAKIYTGYVRPTLEYACPAWHGSLTQALSDQIERVQKRACRIIIGRAFSSYHDALQTLSIPTLQDRRNTLCRDFALGLLDSPFRAWLPPTRAEISNRQTRNSTQLEFPKTRTARYKKSPIPFFTGLLNAK